jgi:hypothetical protein
VWTIAPVHLLIKGAPGTNVPADRRDEKMKLADYRKISGNINDEIKAVLKRHGFEVTKINTGVEESAGTVRLTISASDSNLQDASGEKTTPERERYKRLCNLYDLKPEWLGQTVTHAKVEYRLDGLKDTRGAKAVVVTRLSDNRHLVTTPDFVRVLFLTVGKGVGATENIGSTMHGKGTPLGELLERK